MLTDMPLFSDRVAVGPAASVAITVKGGVAGGVVFDLDVRSPVR